MNTEFSPTDSGISEPMSDRMSPKQIEYIVDEDFDETLWERVVGLSEMFPESIRNSFGRVVNCSTKGVQHFYGFSRSALWVLFTSSAVLLAPLVLEMERSQMEEFSKQQQRQILLGPSAGLSGGGHGLPMPPLSPPVQR